MKGLRIKTLCKGDDLIQFDGDATEAGAETIVMVERNMCNAVMRGTAVPPGSKSTSRAKGSRREAAQSLSQ